MGADIFFTKLSTRRATDELCSGIANGRVLILELYTHRRQTLTLLHLFIDLFRKENFPDFRSFSRLILAIINLANILKCEEIFPYETDLGINAEDFIFVIYVQAYG